MTKKNVNIKRKNNIINIQDIKYFLYCRIYRRRIIENDEIIHLEAL